MTVDGRWQQILEAIPQLVWTASRDGLAEYFSPQGSKFTGLAADALLGRGWLEAVHPDDRALAQDAWTRAVADGREYHAEHRLRRFDGEYRWFSSHATPIRNEAGSVDQWAGVSIDVTDRKIIEERAMRLERAVLGSKAYTWHHELLDGTMEGATSIYTNMWEGLGYDLNDADVPSSIVGLMHPEDAGHFTTAVHAFLAGREREWEREVRLHHKDGTERWYLGRGVVERDPVSGKALCYTGCSVDITARKVMEQKLCESEEKFRATFENAAIGMAVTVEHGRFVDCNNTLCESLGYPKHELIGRRFTDFGAADEAEPDLELHYAFLRGDIPSFSRDKRSLLRDGSIGWANITASVLRRDSEGKPTQVLAMVQDITMRKSLEQDLRKAKDLLELGIRGSDVSIFDFDIAGSASLQGSSFTLMNFWELLGYDPASAPRSYDEAAALVMTPDDAARVRDAIAAYINGDVPRFDIEHRLRHKDGSLIWVLVRGAVVRDTAGVPIRFIGSHVNITERRRAEERLRESEQRWRRLTETLPQLIWTANSDGRIDYFSDQVCGYTGIPEAELIRGAWAEAIHPDERERTVISWRDAVEHRKPHEVQHRLRGRDGAFRWFTTRAAPALDTEGQVFKWVGSSTDITTLKELEEKLRHAKERLEFAIRSSNLSIWEYEMPDGVIETARETLTNVWESLGYDLAAAPTVMGEVIHPDDLSRVGEAIRAYLAAETATFETEHRMKHEDGRYRWVLGRGVGIRDASGAVIRFVGTSVDITELKRIEEDLQRAREVAETANRAKDEFLANVSHEIRTPMNAILGMTELALDSAQTAHQQQLLATVKSAAKSLLEIINDLLDFSKIAAGKLALHEADFSLRGEVGETLRALTARAQRKGIELISHIHADVPDALSGDAGRVRQVLMNLVDNAVKFTARGEVLVDVRTAPDTSLLPARDTVSVVFTVRDTGIGIARDKQAAIFRAFEQADSSTTRQYGGTGLGLTISAQLAALMDGGITVQSEVGRGSAFAFTARFARADRAAQLGLKSPPLLEGMPVLVVDNTEMARILEGWLTSWEMRPTVVGDAKAALEELAHNDQTKKPYSLVLLDVRTPGVDGTTLAEQIMERHRTMRLILLSTDGSPVLATSSRRIGVHAYLPKPAQPSDLLRTISVVMDAKAGEVTEGVRDESAPVDDVRPASPLRILVAEDNELNVVLLKTLLSKRGHLQRFAGDGRVALQLATEETFDVMLLDLHMPGMDGFEVVRAIREREHVTGEHLAIVALTARSSTSDRDRCLAVGMDEFLSKPIEVDALWATIARVTATFPCPRVHGGRLLDASAILRACAGESGVFTRLRDVFRRVLPEHLIRVRSALTDRDLPRLREAGHKLFGTLSVFSTIAGLVASAIEDAAKREDFESCAKLVDQLDAMGAELLEVTRGLTIEDLRL